MGDSMTAETVRIAGQGGEEIEAYLARPAVDGARGGVVVIHHMPGYDRATKEIVRRFAELGYDAICPNLYWREAPGAAPDDAAATARAHGGVPDERLIGDVGGAAAYLRSLPSSNGKVGVIGYCSGGRQAVLAACNLDLDAAVDCYGAFVVGTPPEGFPLQVTNLVGQLPNLRAPLLGLFGNEDSYPSPDQVNELDEILTANDKSHEFHRYDDAGHAFFAVDRPSYSTKPGDRRVIRLAVGSDHPAAHIVHTRALDHPRRSQPLAIRIDQQRDHHPRIDRASAGNPLCGEEEEVAPPKRASRRRHRSPQEASR
jgi:carboxymethylenebutenolidase